VCARGVFGFKFEDRASKTLSVRFLVEAHLMTKHSTPMMSLTNMVLVADISV